MVRMRRTVRMMMLMVLLLLLLLMLVSSSSGGGCGDDVAGMGMMGVTMLMLGLLLLLLLRGIAAGYVAIAAAATAAAAADVVVVAVAVAVVAAAAIGSVEFMLLGGMLLDVHHVQILLVVVLEGRRLGHVLVRGRHHLRGDAHHLVVRRLLLVGRRVRWRAGGRGRWLWTRVVLLVRLAGRGRRRGRGGRRQVLDLRWLRRFVDAVRWLE